MRDEQRKNSLKAARRLANQYNKAVARGDFAKQKILIKKCQIFGIYVKRAKFIGKTKILELHFNNQASDITSQRSHLAYYNYKKEMLTSRPHVGSTVPGQDSDCLWQEQGWVSTLDKTNVIAPE